MPPESEEAETFLYDEKASALLLTSQGSRKLMLPQLIVLRPAGETALEQYRKVPQRDRAMGEGVRSHISHLAVLEDLIKERFPL